MTPWAIPELPGHVLHRELMQTGSFLFSQEDRGDLDIWGECCSWNCKATWTGLSLGRRKQKGRNCSRSDPPNPHASSEGMQEGGLQPRHKPQRQLWRRDQLGNSPYRQHYPSWGEGGHSMEESLVLHNLKKKKKDTSLEKKYFQLMKGLLQLRLPWKNTSSGSHQSPGTCRSNVTAQS